MKKNMLYLSKGLIKKKTERSFLKFILFSIKMSQCFLFTFNLLLISSVVCLVSIILTSHLPYGFRIRFYVFLAEHIYIFAIVLSYELHNAIDRMYLILFLTFGCFLQFGGIEFYLATLPNTEISFDD